MLVISLVLGITACGSSSYAGLTRTQAERSAVAAIQQETPSYAYLATERNRVEVRHDHNRLGDPAWRVTYANGKHLFCVWTWVADGRTAFLIDSC